MSNFKDPRVSVVMSVHNGEMYLREAVESILNQTFRNFEFIIIDDGSTDRSKSILNEYAARDDRIRLISHENRGLTKSLNVGLAVARGELIARMDADDVSLPDRFDHQVRFLEETPDHVAVGCGVMLTDGDLRPLQRRSQPRCHTAICKELLHGNGGAMTHPAVMFRKRALLKLRGYNERFTTAQDLDLFIRLSEIGLLENLEPILLLWRQHPDSINHTKYCAWRSMKRMAIREAIERRGAARFADALLPEQEVGSFAPTAIGLARVAFDGGQLRTALHYAFRALLYGPERLNAVMMMCLIWQRIEFGALRGAYRRVRAL